MRNNKQSFFCRFLVALVSWFACTISSYCFGAEITSPFGWRIHPVSGEYTFHTGVDIGYEYNSPVVAMRSGKIVYAALYGGYGNCIILEHTDGDHTLYAHCSSLEAQYGDMVNQGDLIAYVGSTGISTGPHLHLEWWHLGQYTDPIGLWNSEEAPENEIKEER